MKSIQKGFTLIELMIVVAIIGILAAIAIPAYQDYTIRAQISEANTVSAGLETALVDYYNDKGQWPVADMSVASPTGLGFANAAIIGKYGKVALIAKGTIQETFSNTAPFNANKNIAGKIVGISPAVDANGTIVWVCGNAGTPTGSTLSQATGTDATIKSNWLPSSCKP
jgi:type IV pilus assembly protein PilA